MDNFIFNIIIISFSINEQLIRFPSFDNLYVVSVPMFRNQDEYQLSSISMRRENMHIALTVCVIESYIIYLLDIITITFMLNYYNYVYSTSM